MLFVIDPSCLGTVLSIIAYIFSGGMACKGTCTKEMVG